MSTIAETSANHHLELAPGIERLGKIEEQFMVSPCRAFFRIIVPVPRRLTFASHRAPQSLSTSLSRTAPRTVSSSPRATTPAATSSLRRTTSEASTAGPPARSSSSKASGMVSRLPRNSRVSESRHRQNTEQSAVGRTQRLPARKDVMGSGRPISRRLEYSIYRRQSQ